MIRLYIEARCITNVFAAALGTRAAERPGCAASAHNVTQRQKK